MQNETVFGVAPQSTLSAVPHGESAEGSSRLPLLGKQACLTCRAVKMKCKMVVGQSICERCTRKSLPCIFRSAKRGRKPGSKSVSEVPILSRHSQTLATVKDETDICRSRFPVHRALKQTKSRRAAEAGAQEPVEVTPSPTSSTSPANSSNHGLIESSAQPDPLNHTVIGVHSLTEALFGVESGRAALNTRPKRTDDDPIQKGLVSQHVASSLFHGFMSNMNPLICLFDPTLYTFPYVREQSPFLLTTILAVAAKAFNPPIHDYLYSEVEEMYTASFRRGSKSVETIQALMLFTYWRRAGDTSSWAAIGYVIRLCMELGWHRLPLRTTDAQLKMSEDEVRKQRNIERTWIVLWIHDRGANLQTGRPWMIEKSDFIESVNIWYKSRYATANDSAVCALATQRLTTSDVIEVLNPQRPSDPIPSPQRINPLLRMLTPQLDAWLKHWTHVASDSCHTFIVTFFCNHTRLFLYSFPLQGSLSFGGPLMDNNAFSIAYNSALDMLKSLTAPTVSPMLGFIHDAIHIMIAYAAMFLVKLLLSVHLGIRQEIESTVIEGIESTAQVLEAQETPGEYSCSLQAKFLKNLLRDYRKTFQQRDRVQGSCVMNNGEGEQIAMPLNPGNTVVNGPAPQIRSQPLPNWHNSAAMSSRQISVESQLASASMGFRDFPQRMVGTCQAEGDWALNAPASCWTAGQNELWASMILNAGFDMGEGAFLSDIASPLTS